MALLPGSPAIGAGTATGAPSTDQRGFPLNSPVDIGAFQTQTSPLVVNTTDDTTTGAEPPGDLSLRDAVNLANALSGAETITFDSAVFAKPQTITLAGRQLELTDTTGTETIAGPAAALTVSGGGLSRVFQVDAPVTASISGLTITGGMTGGDGGGLYNLGTATLTNCTVTGNSAGAGGGIFNNSTLAVSNSTLSGNSATGSGGGLDNASGATATVTGSNVKKNSAGVGGGIANQGTLTVDSSTISKNTATSAGGGISTTGGGVNISNSVINLNQVNSSGTALGGGIDCENSTLSLTNTTVNANQANGTNAYGGGIYALSSTLTLQSCTVNANKANGTTLGEGGGIFNSNSVLTLLTTTVKGNKATTAFDNIGP
jgi:hypothetical protein